MKQNKLKILCVYHDSEPAWLSIPPEEALSEHEVTVAHTYSDAQKCITDEARGIPPFDIVLSDVTLPGGFDDQRGDAQDLPFPAVFFQPNIGRFLIRGLGIFVPQRFETVFDMSDGYSVAVATKECWTPFGTRDWVALLELVIETSGEAESFQARIPKE